MAEAHDHDIRHKLSEMEHRARKRRRMAAMWTFAPTCLVAAILIAFLFLVRDRQRKLDEKQQAIEGLEQKKEQLDQEISKSTQEVEQKRKEIAELAAEQKELADYSNKLRDLLPKKGILEEKGKIPDKLKAALQPRAKVTSRSGRRHAELYDVDLWIEVPPGSENAIDSVTYDLDAAFYKNNHFTGDPGAPHAPVSFTVLGCESKVLIAVTLKEPQGSLTMDFDWCKTPGWSDDKDGARGRPVRMDHKPVAPAPAVGSSHLVAPSSGAHAEAAAPDEPPVAGRPLVNPRQSLDSLRDPANLRLPPKN